MERMASGLKINSAKDDPSGFYLSSKFTTQINGLTVANNNIQNAIDILGQADESLKEINELLGKMRDLIESSCSEYLTPSEREENQKKINAYFQQALQIKNETEVDGRKIFSEKISLDKNVTYTDGHAVTEAGNALATSFVDDSTPAAQPASMPVVDSGIDSGADNGVAAADFVDTGMAAYSPEDEWGAVYSPEDDYGSLYDESAYSDDEEETAFVFDDGVQNAGIAMADTESDGIACYSGEEDPNAGISIASETGNDGIAVASTIVDSGSIEVTSTSQPITIGDKMYDVHGYGSGTLNWSIDDAGQITFQTDSTNTIFITAHDGQEDNVSLDGSGIYFYAGDMDDTIVINSGCHVDGDDGDDSIVNNSLQAALIDGNAGNDTIVNNAGATVHYIYGEAGNDSIVNEGTVNYDISGGAHNDSIVNNGTVYWNIVGGLGSDTVVHNGNASFIFGAHSGVHEETEAETDKLVFGSDALVGWQGSALGVDDIQTAIEYSHLNDFDIIVDEDGNDLLNPTSGSIDLTDTSYNSPVTITIGDKKYDVYSSSETTTLYWDVDNDTGQITFLINNKNVASGTEVSITAHDGQADNVIIDGNIRFYAGDGNDTVEAWNAYGVYSGTGDDNITVTEKVYEIRAAEGNDSIVNNGTVIWDIASGLGDDTIINAADAYVSTIIGSDGNDSIVNNGVIQCATPVGYGNDTIINNGTMGIRPDTDDATGNVYVENNENGYLTSLGLGSGNDYVINKGTITSSIFLGVGNDTIYDYGDGYLGLDAGDGDDYLYIYSEGNHIYGYHGNDYIYIHGNDNHVDGHEGDDMIFVYSDGNEIAGGGGSDDIMISGDNNIAYGSSSSIGGTNDGFNTITTSGKNNTYSGFDELNNGNQSMNIQTDWNINDYSSYTLNLDLFLPEIEFDISTAENAQLSLTQLDEIIKGLSNSRTSIGAQNLVLEEQLNHNTIRISNIENSRSIIRDADTAEEYNNLITQASMVQQIQTLQAQANSNHYNLVSQLIYGVVA